MAKKHLRKCSKSLVIREMQIKTTLRFHVIPIRMAKTKKPQEISHASEGVEQGEHFFIAGESAHLYNHCRNQFGSFSENWE